MKCTSFLLKRDISWLREKMYQGLYYNVAYGPGRASQGLTEA